MQINHNIRAMVTQHALYSNNSAMSKSLEKLSTGLRINRAQDDAAGLAMSEQMRTQIRGLGKAKQNAQDGMAALQIAEGGLAEITNVMQRQRELAVQAANDTLTSTERKYLNDEFQELTKEIGRIALGTDYNGKNLLSNGSFGKGGVTSTPTSTTYTVAGPKVGSTVSLTPNNSFGAVDANTKLAQSFTLHVGANYSANAGGIWANQLAVTYSGITFNSDSLMDFTIGKYGAGTTLAGVNVKFGQLSICGTITVSFGNKSIGGQQLVYLAIDALDGAIKSISGARAKIGTFINRLEYTVNNIASMEFNTQDAESRIRDTNFALETTNFTRNQIMVQSATSMLAQANSLPQSVLGLLG